MRVFNCQVQAEEGGASMYVYGVAVAERLRKENPETSDFFTNISITYQPFDEMDTVSLRMVRAFELTRSVL